MLEPNRNYVIEADGSIHKMLFCGDADWEEKATTSLQEIRNNAIDEFAERLLTCGLGDFNNVPISEIKRIAEEMRGE